MSGNSIGFGEEIRILVFQKRMLSGALTVNEIPVVKQSWKQKLKIKNLV